MSRPMTLGEKILAHAAGVKSVSPGDMIMAKLDLCLGNDITAPLAIQAFYDNSGKKVFDRKRVALVPGSFHAQQGHQIRRAGENFARLRARAETALLLGPGRGRNRARAVCPSRASWFRATW